MPSWSQMRLEHRVQVPIRHGYTADRRKGIAVGRQVPRLELRSREVRLEA